MRERHDALYEHALAHALSLPESTEAMRTVRVEPEEVAGALRARKDAVWSSVAAEAAGLWETEEKQRLATTKLAAFKSAPSRWIPRGAWLSVIVLSIGSSALAGTGTGQTSVLFSVLNGIGVLALLVAVIAGLRRLETGHNLRSELKPQLLAAQLTAAGETLAPALLSKGVMPEIRKAINDRLGSSSGRQLVYLSARGLRETSDHQYEVPTPTRQRLIGLLGRLEGGTIGITGPRGAGKTTLIRSLCVRNFFTDTGDGTQLSVVVSAPVQYDGRDFLLYLSGTVCRTVLGTDANRLDRPTSLWARLVQSTTDRIRTTRRDKAPTDGGRPGGQSTGAGESTEEAMARLRIEAAVLLNEIEWQQTYSTGWSGALRLPASLGEAGRTVGREITRRQRSYPQLADDLRTFLSHAAANGRVVIGIDELDKMDSAGTAQTFLNDLKALFGLDGCFFLISVSENALGEFQRRALGFRNIFDSCFDDIVRVPSLTAAESVRLLERRIIGLPVLFATLCHCLSGGLPRDLIRVARNLVELQDGPDTDVGRICVSLVRQELMAGVDAVIHCAGPDGARSDATLVRWLGQLDHHAGRNSLLDHCQELLTQLGPATAGLNGGSSAATLDADLAHDVLALAYYCATVTDCFSGERGDDVLDEIGSSPEGSTVVQELVRARHVLALHPTLAWESISAFRSGHGLRLLPGPHIPTCAAPSAAD